MVWLELGPVPILKISLIDFIFFYLKIENIDMRRDSAVDALTR